VHEFGVADLNVPLLYLISVADFVEDLKGGYFAGDGSALELFYLCVFDCLTSNFAFEFKGFDFLLIPEGQ
jgi:hypothetical protein